MSVLVLASAKGSPGVTTLAHRLGDALARREEREREAPRPVVVVEADPAGGDLAARRGLAGAPGLASLALSARRSLAPDGVLAHCQRLGRVHVLAGVAGCRQGAIVAPFVPRLVEALRAVDAVVLIDAGRLAPSQEAESELLRDAELVALVTRTAAECVVHARSAIDMLRSAGVAAELVLVGRPEYPAQTITSAVGAPVLAVVADAPAEAAADPGALLRGRRGDLARSVEVLARIVGERMATAAGTPAGASREPGWAPARTENELADRQVVPLRALRTSAVSPAAPA